jgi:SAM-dependent methyltransferase
MSTTDASLRARPIRERREPAEPELLDQPGLSAAQIERALSGLARVNRLLLGYRPVVAAMVPRLAGGPAAQRLVDLGTGSGHGAARVAREAAAHGIEVRVIGVDRKLAHLVVGRRWGTRQLPVVADATALPFAAGACDWALSSLLFHHFGATANRRMLDEMRRVARRGAVVVDLRPGRLPYWLARLLIPLVGGCRVTRHDGPASVACAWPLEAVRRLTADLPVAELRRRFPFRWSLVLGGSFSAPTGPPSN